MTTLGAPAGCFAPLVVGTPTSLEGTRSPRAAVASIPLLLLLLLWENTTGSLPTAQPRARTAGKRRLPRRRRPLRSQRSMRRPPSQPRPSPQKQPRRPRSASVSPQEASPPDSGKTASFELGYVALISSRWDHILGLLI